MRFRTLIFAAICCLVGPDLLAQDYAGTCNDCAACMIRDQTGNWCYGSTCASWGGEIPDCTPWGCGSGCMGNGRAVCSSDSQGEYHYQLLHIVQGRPTSKMKLVSAVMTTEKGKRSILVKRAS